MKADRGSLSGRNCWPNFRKYCITLTLCRNLTETIWLHETTTLLMLIQLSNLIDCLPDFDGCCCSKLPPRFPFPVFTVYWIEPVRWYFITGNVLLFFLFLSVYLGCCVWIWTEKVRQYENDTEKSYEKLVSMSVKHHRVLVPLPIWWEYQRPNTSGRRWRGRVAWNSWNEYGILIPIVYRLFLYLPGASMTFNRIFFSVRVCFNSSAPHHTWISPPTCSHLSAPHNRIRN